MKITTKIIKNAAPEPDYKQVTKWCTSCNRMTTQLKGLFEVPCGFLNQELRYDIMHRCKKCKSLSK